MAIPIIFLDIDGVLNGHDRHANGYCGIHPDKVERLNRIVRETGAKIVISSAWRYMVRKGAMTLDGFRYLLLIHGLDGSAELLPPTMLDEKVPGRGEQINHWLIQWARREPRVNYVVIDDGSDERQFGGSQTLSESLATHHLDRWVKTDSAVGLTDADVDRAIAILTAPPPPPSDSAPASGQA